MPYLYRSKAPLLHRYLNERYRNKKQHSKLCDSLYLIKHNSRPIRCIINLTHKILLVRPQNILQILQRLRPQIK